MKLDFNTIIIGSGVAGMTSAIYLKRSNISFMIIEKDAPGGQLLKISSIQNYPGVLDIDGTDLAILMSKQLKELEIEINHDTVLDIVDNNEYKTVKTTKNSYTCKNIIIATGKTSKTLGLPNEKKLLNNGISYCAICDGPLYKDKDVAVVGGGNSALEEAMYLSKICKSVTLIHRKDTFRADASIVDEVINTPNINIKYNTFIKELKEENNKLSSIIINNGDEISVSGLFIFIGSIPTTIFTKNLKLKMDNNYIIVDKNMRTNVNGIYAVGDIIKKDFYQIVTATSEGAIAALTIKLDNKNE